MKRMLVLCTILLLGSIAFSATTWAALTQTQVSQLYVGVFGRASEGDGNSYWRTDPNSTSMTAIANVMLNTDPAKAYFGTTLENALAFIEHIYLNTLGKTYSEDPAGIDYWVGELDGGKSKGKVIAALVVAAQDPINAGVAQDRFNNKVEVSNYCAERIAGFTILSTFTGFITSVTDDPESVVYAKGLIDALADTQKLLIKIQTDGPPPDGNINHVIYYTYDSAGYLIKHEYDRNNNGTIDNVDYYTNDADGNLIQKNSDTDNDGDINIAVTYTRDSSGNLTKIETDVADDGDIDAVSYYTNDSGGNLVVYESDVDNDTDIDSIVYYTNDASGRPDTIETDSSGDGDIDSVVYYTYDAFGNLVKYEFDTNNDGDIDSEGVANYTYDSEGNILQIFSDLDNDGDIDQKNYYTYQ